MEQTCVQQNLVGDHLRPAATIVRWLHIGLRPTKDNTRSPKTSTIVVRLMLPDSRLGTDGFHDVLIDNLAASPSWQSGHISPADVTALRRCWPKAVFKTMRRRAQEVERLSGGARHRPDRAFCHSAPGFCPVCEVRIDSDLDMHMLNFHLELAQLWRCPVEWCTVWKGSVRGCLDHLTDKHGGSTFFALKNVAKFFPPWMVTRDVRMCRALRWTHSSSMRPDVDWNIVTEYTRIRFLIWCSGGGGMIPRLLSFVCRAMTIAQLTHLRISIPASGAPPGLLPTDYYPGGIPSQDLPSSRRVSFAEDVTVLGDATPPACAPEGGTPTLLDSAVAEDHVITTMGETIACSDTSPTIIPPPPGFSKYSWPYEDWSVNNGQSLFTFTKDPPGCVPDVSEGRPVVVPSLPLSPISPDSADDSVTVTATMGSCRDESIFPSEVGVMVPPLGDVRLGLTAAVLRAVSPLPSIKGLIQEFLWAPVAPRSPDVADRRAPCSANQVPRWRLAREGPFLAERSPDTIRSFGARCAFRNTTYRASDYASPSGEFGLPMHHPRFLKWIAVPQSASLLEMGPGRWLDFLSRDQAMAVAVQLQRDVCRRI